MSLLIRSIERRAKQIGVLVVGGVALCASHLSIAQNEYAISYSNAELTTFAGVQDVHARIVAAARNYCPSYSQIRSQRDVKSCVEGVVKDLVNKIDHPLLTDYHAGDESVRLAAMRQVNAPRT
jgi:UrcA family protein